MIKFLVKKYVVSKINSLLSEYKDNVDKVREVLNVWISRIQKIIEKLQNVSNRLEDGKLTDEEIDESVEDIETIIKEW